MPSSKSKVVQWEGLAHRRVISAEDLRKVNVNASSGIDVDRRDRMTKGQAVVPENVAKYLTEFERGFREVTDQSEYSFSTRESLAGSTSDAGSASDTDDD